MDAVSFQRLFGWREAFAHPFTIAITVAVAAVLGLGYLSIALLRVRGRTTPELHAELLKRAHSWAVLAPLLILPILLGAAWTIAGIALLSLACFREFARATGLFRERLIVAVVVLGIVTINLAVIDHWYAFFAALPALVTVVLAVMGILPDAP